MSIISNFYPKSNTSTSNIPFQARNKSPESANEFTPVDGEKVFLISRFSYH